MSYITKHLGVSLPSFNSNIGTGNISLNDQTKTTITSVTLSGIPKGTPVLILGQCWALSSDLDEVRADVAITTAAGGDLSKIRVNLQASIDAFFVHKLYTTVTDDEVMSLTIAIADAGDTAVVIASSTSFGPSLTAIALRA